MENGIKADPEVPTAVTLLVEDIWERACAVLIAETKVRLAKLNLPGDITETYEMWAATEYAARALLNATARIMEHSDCGVDHAWRLANVEAQEHAIATLKEIKRGLQANMLIGTPPAGSA